MTKKFLVHRNNTKMESVNFDKILLIWWIPFSSLTLICQCTLEHFWGLPLF